MRCNRPLRAFIHVYQPLFNFNSSKCVVQGLLLDTFLGLYSLSGKTSYRKISWSLEAARFGFKLFQSLWNLAGTSAALLPRCLSNFRAIRPLQHPISRLRDFTRFGGKTSYRLVNRGPGVSGKGSILMISPPCFHSAIWRLNIRSHSHFMWTQSKQVFGLLEWWSISPNIYLSHPWMTYTVTRITCHICCLIDTENMYDDVIKWKHFPHYWPFVWGIHRSIPAQRPVTRSSDVFCLYILLAICTETLSVRRRTQGQY